MSNYVEFNDKIAFHPGYYVKEIIEESGLTQEDFAKRLDTTPKNISLLIRGEQSLSVDISMKLARMLGTSMTYWMNLQTAYDAVKAEIKSASELEKELQVLKYLDYNYFVENYKLPKAPRKKEEQVKNVREFLKVSTLELLSKDDIAVNFRGDEKKMTLQNIVKANAMVQTAINEALSTESPKYDKHKFEKAVNNVLLETSNHTGFYKKIKKSFLEAGVILEVLPNMTGSMINGATKRVGNSVMLMVSDRGTYADIFWFTLFHEIGHIMNGDFGISIKEDDNLEEKKNEKEEAADRYAEEMLINPKEYNDFIKNRRYDVQSIQAFAQKINRDPGIVVGRLLKNKEVEYTNRAVCNLRSQYKVLSK